MIADAIDKTPLISVLVACKCEIPPERRQLHPQMVERKASASLSKITAHQVSQASPESYKKGLAVLLQRLINAIPSNGTSMSAYCTPRIIASRWRRKGIHYCINRLHVRKSALFFPDH